MTDLSFSNEFDDEFTNILNRTRSSDSLPYPESWPFPRNEFVRASRLVELEDGGSE